MERRKLTSSEIQGFKLPDGTKQAFLWDKDTKQLAVRVTSGAKAYIFQSRLKSGTEIRLTIGSVDDWGIKQAQVESRRLQMLIDQGNDPRDIRKAVRAEKVAEEQRSTATLEHAIREYLKRKRRDKDGLPLKERTKQDYLALIAPSRQMKNGNMTQPGILAALASKSIYSLTAGDIRAVHDEAMKRSERWAAYSMQVLRAVLNWHGVKIPDNPLGKDVAGKDRIRIPAAKATGQPIPAERIGAWWRAVDLAASDESRNYIRFLVLTGCRPAEPKLIKVEDCDLVAGRVFVRDTKNRRDHQILLSRQAAAIVAEAIEGKKPAETLFDVVDAKKTIATIIKRSGAVFRLKDLRPTFASIAEELTSAYTLKRMMNHADAGDITGAHYVRKGDAALRAGWQAVADFIEAQAAADVPAGVVDLDSHRKQVAA